MKGILASGLVSPQVDLDGLWHYVSMRFLPDRYSAVQRHREAAGGHLAALAERHGDHRAVLAAVASRTSASRREDEVIDELDALLRETVEMHLLSDVRVGSFLSGGIDSSLIAALMATVGKETVPTFSIGVKEQGFNELPYARSVAARYGMEAHEKVVEADLFRLIPPMVYHMDEPADPFGAGVYLVSGVARETVKVVLTGDGGDESFAGYDRFVGQRLLDYYCVLPAWFRRHLVRGSSSASRSPSATRAWRRRRAG